MPTQQLYNYIANIHGVTPSCMLSPGGFRCIKTPFCSHTQYMPHMPLTTMKAGLLQSMQSYGHLIFKDITYPVEATEQLFPYRRGGV